MCVQSIAPITLGKPAIATNCILMFGWSTTSYGKLIYLVDMRMIQSHTAGIARLKDDWLIPERSASSLWKEPVARKQSVVSTCKGTGIAWLLAVSLSKFGPNSAQNSKRIALGNLKRLISQSSSWARKSLWSLKTCSLRILPLAMSSDKANAAIAID